MVTVYAITKPALGLASIRPGTQNAAPFLSSSSVTRTAWDGMALRPNGSWPCLIIPDERLDHVLHGKPSGCEMRTATANILSTDVYALPPLPVSPRPAPSDRGRSRLAHDILICGAES